MTVTTDAIDVERIEADLRTLIRIPSVTGSEEAVQAEMERLFREIGLETARIETDPAAFAADPDFPGAEMPRTSLPVVTGRLGRAGGGCCSSGTSMSCRRATPRPGPRIHGAPRSATARCTAAGRAT